MSSIILKVIAGFFFYTVSLLAFVNGPQSGAKLGMLIGFSVPAVVAMVIGLAMSHFRNWRRDVGVVFISSAGFTAFLIFTFACLLMTNDFRKIMGPDTLAFFSDYLTGFMVVAGLAIVGLMLMKANREPKGVE